MKILIISVGPWNDIQYGNNINTNWFSGYDAEFAQIFVHEGKPCNQICEKYFQITDQMMLNSLKGKRAGVTMLLPFSEQQKIQQQVGVGLAESKVVKRAKKVPANLSAIFKDLVWQVGRVDESAISLFVQEFNPDIVFCTHLFDYRFYRVERIVKKYTNAPFVAFTGDSEASLEKYSWSPLFWIRQVILNIVFRRHIKIFDHYFTFSQSLADKYHKLSGIPTSTLYKCADFSDSLNILKNNQVIKMVYAGNLYCNRWVTLHKMAEAIELINKDKSLIQLDIYTNTQLTQEMSTALNNYRGTKIHGRVAPSELDCIYRDADIALHIESFDKKNRLDTKESFSTKIVDLMNSTCAILAICWKEHNGLKYLRKEDAAICVDSLDDIYSTLDMLCQNRNLIQQYAHKAFSCGKRNHTKEHIQSQITSIFSNLISKK